MLDEEMDHIIRDAADKHHPAYNDKAWEKMEAKLDKHLPQKKDRRKFIFFLLFFLLLGGAALFSVFQFTGTRDSGNKKTIVNNIDELSAGNNDQKNSIAGNDNTNADTTDNSKGPGNENADKEAVTTTVQGINKNTSQQDDKTATGSEVFRKPGKNVTAGKSKSRIGIVAATPVNDELSTDETGAPAGKRLRKKNNAGKTNVVITAAEPETDDNGEVANTVPEKTTDKIKEDTGKEKEKVKTEEEKKEKQLTSSEDKPNPPADKKKNKNKFGNNFGITVSAGPDLSFVSLDKLGKATLAYGAGLSYTFAKRLTVRTGFYFSKKIYSASPDQYHTPGGNYPYLDIVDAACKVYEIPVSLSYKFGERKKHSWFGSAGLSSFLMKTEDYDYKYKLPSGQTYNYAWNVSNENKHYFSVLTLSGGYQYNFSKRVSVQAEPYVKLPLGGIGIGKIKLNSSGILLTLTVKPFAKK